MRTRSGSQYQQADLPPNPPDSALHSSRAQPSMELDALDAAITSLDIAGPVTNEALAQLLRGLATTLTTRFAETLARKDAQIVDLQGRMGVLEERCDDLEQYSRRNTMRIRGVPETAGENTDAVVQELAARKLEVRVADHDVVRSHRVGRKTEDRQTPRDVIVRLTTHNMKATIMQSARKLKGTRIFINEDMTKTRATIAWEARNLKRDKKILDTWTRDGVVFVKTEENNIKAYTTERHWKAFTNNL